MTDQEQAFIDGIEFALDYRLDGITEEDMNEYRRLIEKREEEEKVN